MNVTLYCVHSDVDTGASLDVFTSEQAEREHCLKLMKENGTTRVQELIADGEFEEAWCLFNEQETGDLSYHFRHEVDVTL